MKALVRIIIGLIFGGICALALSPAFAAFHSEGSSIAPIVTFGTIGVVVLAAFFAPSIRRAVGRGFLLSGVSFLFLPISTFFLAGRAFNETVSATQASDQAFAAVGAGAGVAVITGAATFFGLVLGGIFVIIGLVFALGGRREVVIVQR